MSFLAGGSSRLPSENERCRYLPTFAYESLLQLKEQVSPSLCKDTGAGTLNGKEPSGVTRSPKAKRSRVNKENKRDSGNLKLAVDTEAPFHPTEFSSPLKAEIGAKEASHELAGIIRRHCATPEGLVGCSPQMEVPEENLNATAGSKQEEETQEAEAPLSSVEVAIIQQREELWKEFFEKNWCYGDKFDIFDRQLEKWYVGRVYDILFVDSAGNKTTLSSALGKPSLHLRKNNKKVARPVPELTVRDAENKLKSKKGNVLTQLKIQYHGWHHKWDSWIDIPTCENVESGLKAGPLHMFTTAPAKKVKAKPKVTPSFVVITEEEKPKLYWETKPIEGKRGGRKRRIEAVERPKARETKTVHNEEEVDQNDWLCAVCGEIHFKRKISNDQSSELLVCDGGCLQSFHLKCLGLTKPPKQKKWKCDECKQGEHTCKLCDEYADDAELLCCEEAGCAKYYHEACLKTYSRKYTKYVPHFRGKLRCPMHFCNVCQTYATKKIPVACCLHCDASFHLGNCMVPGTRYNRFAVICPSHPNKLLPFTAGEENMITPGSRDLTVNEVFDVDKNIPLRKPALNDRSDSNHFRLPNDLLLHTATMVPEFVHLKRSLYTGCKPVKHTDEFDYETRCACSGRCDSKCQNKNLRLECCSKLCSVGENCGNRKFNKRQYKTVLPYPTPGKGWGLKIMEPVKQGEFILEYIGEVLDNAAAEARLQDEASDRHFYQMELEANRIVDAKNKGNVSRFINHSCDPNIEVQKWCVNGYFRLGFFALRDLEVGEELSYDYKFFSSDKSIVCSCGAKNCRGTLRTVSKKTLKAKEVEQERKAQKDKILLHAKDGKLTKRMLQKILDDTNGERREREEKQHRLQLQTKQRLSQTAMTVPGDLTRTISQGPATLHRRRVRETNIFLWRTAVQGGNFIERQQLRKRDRSG